MVNSVQNTVYSKYRKSTGEVVAHLKLNVSEPPARLDDFAFYTGYLNPNTQYVVDGEAVERPKFSTMASIGDSAILISGLPEGTQVSLKGVVVDEVGKDGNFEYTFHERLSFAFDLWPYQTKVIKVDP